MNKRLIFALVYLFVGGALCGPALSALERDCKLQVSVVEASAMFATWPAWVAAAVFTDTSGTKSCAISKEPGHEGG